MKRVAKILLEFSAKFPCASCGARVEITYRAARRGSVPEATARSGEGPEDHMLVGRLRRRAEEARDRGRAETRGERRRTASGAGPEKSDNTRAANTKTPRTHTSRGLRPFIGDGDWLVRVPRRCPCGLGRLSALLAPATRAPRGRRRRAIAAPPPRSDNPTPPVPC